ncbi:MAG: ADP-forming succinate--CoA ligase subunit beta [Gammaproteobacteria bacterium]|nr:MAG: ADP-forming succinate--CoA ligase subunit beta [Gammaproteobacteria bacterium]
MHLHEYQAKRLFAERGIPVPEGRLARTPEEARAAARDLGGSGWVVKAQVHAGGRGKAGGVRLVDSPQAAAEAAADLLGTRLVTHQTGPEGQPVEAVLVERTEAIERELYLGMLVDRERERVVVMASASGGMDIERVAAEHPEALHVEAIHPAAGLMPYQARKLAYALGLGAQVRAFTGLLEALAGLFHAADLGLVEINPLVVTGDGRLLALDAKVNVDDNALHRHPELQAMRDPGQEDPRERRAREHDLNYVHLDGDIGCMVNGAGLAMATMDLIQLHGGRPANFLDVGGTATAERVAEAFKLILSDEKVRAILVNIFGGIVRCDLIAEGIIQAVREVRVGVPVVVRLEGTNVERGRELLAASGLDLVAVSDLTEAAQRVVALAREGGRA